MYAWGDNDHGQQGNNTTVVNRKPAMVQGLEGYRINKVACGSSHSIAWFVPDTSIMKLHEPVLFSKERDPLGAASLGKSILANWCYIINCVYTMYEVIVILC